MVLGLQVGSQSQGRPVLTTRGVVLETEGQMRGPEPTCRLPVVSLEEVLEALGVGSRASPLGGLGGAGG